MALDLGYYQKLLSEERQKLEEQLGSIAHRTPDSPRDWEVTPPDLNITSGSKDEDADQEEELENRTGVELALESRLHDINDAFERIKHGFFGICAVGKEEIDEARLKANPAARTCMEHAENEPSGTT